MKAGTANVAIYEPQTYTVSYQTNPPVVVTGSRDVVITMNDKIQRLIFPPIPDASFSVQIDRGFDIPVEVFLADDYGNGKSKLLGSVSGDGLQKFDLSEYGYGTDLVLVYRRAGWTEAKEERVKLEEPNQVFIFTVGANLDKCKQFERSGKYDEACNECEKIPESSSDYCESRNTMIEIYSNKLGQPEKALKACLDYVENSNCGENFTYSLKLFSLVSQSQVAKVPKKLLDPVVLQRFFDNTINQITVQAANRAKSGFREDLSSYACDYGIELIKYYSIESKKFKTRSEEFQSYIDDIRTLIRKKWIIYLPSSEKNTISKKLEQF